MLSRHCVKMAALLIYTLFISIHSASSVTERNHWGTEFVIPFLANFEKKGSVHVYIMTKVETSVYVEIPWENRQEHLTIASSSRGSITLPWTIRYEENMEITQKSVYVNSTEPVAVYGFSYVSNSASTLLAIPVNVLGDHYIAVSYIPQNYNSSVVVAAVENDTEVTFHYNTNGGSCGPHGQAYMNGDTSTHILNRLDVIGVHCSKDLTGTEITSSKPVSVVSGNVGAKILISNGGTDTVEEMLIPVKDFGKEYVLTNAGRSAGTVNRIIAVEDNTEVISSTGDVYNLMKSEFVDIDTDVDGEQCIHSNMSIFAVAFGKGLKANPDSQGDPLMVIIPPVNRFHYDFLIDFNGTSDGSEFTGSAYITVVGKLSDISYLESVLSASHAGLDNCSYGVIHKEVTSWPVQINTPNTTRVGATLYGVGRYIGFGMALGMVLVPQYCWTSTCGNNSVCEEIDESFVCHCDTGYTGDRCQTVMGTSSTLVVSGDTSPSIHWYTGSDVSYTHSLKQDSLATTELTTDHINPSQASSMFDTRDLSLLSKGFKESGDSQYAGYITPTHLMLDSDVSGGLMTNTPNIVGSGDTNSVTSSIIKDTGPQEVILSSYSIKAASVSSSRVVVEVCTCTCKASRLNVLEERAVKEATDKIQSQLLLNTKTLSTTIRKRTSAPDHRMSAKNVGALGIALLALTFGTMIIPDIHSTLRAVRRYFKKRHRTGSNE